MTKNVKKTQVQIKGLKEFTEQNKSQPVLLGYFHNQAGFVFSGAWTVDQLTFMKELLNRKIDSMLDPAFNFGVDMKPQTGKAE